MPRNCGSGVQQRCAGISHSHFCALAGRQHDIKVQLPASYPRAAPLVQADLPEEAPTLQWQPEKSSLAALLHHYEAAIEGYQELWGCLEDLDRSCPVQSLMTRLPES